MLPLIAQLDCAVESVAVETARSDGRPESLDHYLEFRDALTGEPLGAADVAALTVHAVGDAPLRESLAESSPDGATLRRIWAPAAAGESYRLRVDGGASRRYFGCERSLPYLGPAVRRVRVSLVPRSRDVTVTVAVRRASGTRALPPAGLRAVELRPAAEVEREVEVRRGRCSGEDPVDGSHWCVQSLGEVPGPIDLSASTPGYGLVTLRVDARSAERTLAVTAAYEGHFIPTATLRIGASFAPLNGNGPGAFVSLDVLAPSALHGQTCPIADTCVRALARLGAGYVPFTRPTTFIRADGTAASDRAVEGDLAVVEVGGGVTVVPAGTGDTLRLSAVAAAVLGLRGEERVVDTTGTVSPATSRLGAAAEFSAAWRFLGPLFVHAGARLQGFPAFGTSGRRFSFLGDAPLSGEAASLLQFAVFAGIGIEP